MGYDDFPLEGQKKFLEILDASKRVGVCVNSSMMLTPTKSVTCVIGLGHNLKVSSQKDVYKRQIIYRINDSRQVRT